MIRLSLVLALLLSCFSSALIAEDRSGIPVSEEQWPRLQKSFAQMQQQQLTVQVLLNQYNKELSEFRRMEALFCDYYKLDLALWRADRYRFDEQSRSFYLIPENQDQKEE